MTRIVLADDHPMIRTAIEVLLRDTRYKLEGTARSGVEALSEVDRANRTSCSSTWRCRKLAEWKSFGHFAPAIRRRGS